jgi:hypothetical protein
MHVNPVIFTLTILLIAVFVYMQWKKKQQAAPPPAPKVDKDAALRAEVDRLTAAKPEDPPEAVYMNLRAQALETSPSRFAALPDRQPADPYGTLMELGIPNSVVTLAAFADGDAGLYYKTGGGMKGGVSHEPVRKAAKEFVALAKQALSKMDRAAGFPLPEPDRVRFYVLTPQGIFSTETDRETLGESEGELSVLFYAGQEVVAQMRQVQEQRTAKVGA